MDPKPKIEYIGQYYIHGSEAAQPEVKTVKPKTTLPRIRREKIEKIYINPVALCGIIVAVSMLVVMAVGAFRLHHAWQGYNAMENTLVEMKRENARLDHTYRVGYDAEAISEMAEEMHLIPIAEAETMRVRVRIPEKAPPRTAWDDFKWFISGLFAE